MRVVFNLNVEIINQQIKPGLRLFGTNTRRTCQIPSCLISSLSKSYISFDYSNDQNAQREKIDRAEIKSIVYKVDSIGVYIVVELHAEFGLHPKSNFKTESEEKMKEFLASLTTIGFTEAS